MMLDLDTISTGKALRIWNGGLLRRRFQKGHLFSRGKRQKVWVGRYLEPILDNGKIRTVLRSKVIGPCKDMSKSAARTTLQGWLRPLNEGVHIPIETAGFQEFYGKWERDLLPTYRESTREFYRSTAACWILPYFKDWRLSEIRPVDVQQFVNLFSGKYSQSVLKHIRATLNCLFTTAVDWRYAKENPAASLKLPEGKAVQRATVLQPEQIHALIDRLAEPYRTMAIVAAVTGMRESEVLALQWADFDLDHNTITIRRRMYRGKMDVPKSLKSAREIPLHPAVRDAVLALPRLGDFIFASPRGGVYEPSAVLRKKFRPVGKALGLPVFTWRSFRRSAESAMHKSGVPLKAQQAVLGHSDPNMTLVYAETDETGKRAAVEELGKLIFPKFSQIATPVATGLVN
jgi:integrase